MTGSRSRITGVKSEDRPLFFYSRTADIAAAFEEIGQTRGRNSQVNGSGAAGAALVG